MRFGLIGPSYTARSSAIADEETINLYVETRESSGAIAPSKEYGGSSAGGNKSLLWTPGTSVFATAPAGPVRAQLWTGSRLFAVAGNNLCEVLSSGAVTVLGAVANDGNPASMAYNGLQLLVVAAGRAYCYTLATRQLLDVTAQLVGIPLQVVFCDSYFVVIFQNSSKFQMSDPLDGSTWPGLQVNEVEVFTENITAAIVNHRELWLYGSRHAQPYQNTGTTEIFDVIPGAFIETGCAATFVPCKLDNSVFWISEDDRGGRMAWRSNGYTPSRISTHAVELDLDSYPTLMGMTSYSYQDGGHLFWVLYVPGSPWSWVYDVTEQLWHKRNSWINGRASAHRSWNHSYAFGFHLVGDWNSGNFYALSKNNLTDNGNYIRRVRRAPTVIDEMRWIRHNQLTIDADMGSLSAALPADLPGYASSLLGPAAPTSSVSTHLGGNAWTNPGGVLSSGAGYATSSLTAVISSNTSSVSTGTSQGGGAPWVNPGNVDAGGSTFASVSLSAGGSKVTPSQPTGEADNAANPSNQHPDPVFTILGGLPSTAATSATVYVTLYGNLTASYGGGEMDLDLSADNGATWANIGSWFAQFNALTIPITVTGITDVSTIRLRMKSSASCNGYGFANVYMTVSNWYAVIGAGAQPTAQTLVADVAGLTIPDGTQIVGVGVSFNADYTGVAPIFQIGLSVGNIDLPFTLTTSPAIYTAGGSAALWGHGTWTAADLAGLKVNFFTSSTGTTTVNVNQLTVTVYYVQSNLFSDALDITTFGMNPPATTAPQGIIASLVAYASLTGVNLTLQLLKNGIPVGDAQTVPLGLNPVVLTFGALNALFGEEWSLADLSAAGFGLRVTANTASGQTTNVFVGYTTMQLYCVSTTQEASSQPFQLLDGNGNPRPPQMIVRWSDDRGKTWSNDHLVDCGYAGNYRIRAIVRRLGRSRYRVYEISMTDPVPWVIADGYLEAQ